MPKVQFDPGDGSDKITEYEFLTPAEAKAQGKIKDAPPPTRGRSTARERFIQGFKAGMRGDGTGL